MADNYLEKQMDDYRKRKLEWERKKKHHASKNVKTPPKPSASTNRDENSGYRDGE